MIIGKNEENLCSFDFEDIQKRVNSRKWVKINGRNGERACIFGKCGNVIVNKIMMDDVFVNVATTIVKAALEAFSHSYNNDKSSFEREMFVDLNNTVVTYYMMYHNDEIFISSIPLTMEIKQKIVPEYIKRHVLCDTYFGKQDMGIDIILWCFPRNDDSVIQLEEYIVEQCPFHIEGKYLVIEEESGITYDEKRGLIVPKKYNI
jgi:hypothetical protein